MSGEQQAVYEEMCRCGGWAGCRRCLGTGIVSYKTPPEQRLKQRQARWQAPEKRAQKLAAKYGAAGDWISENRHKNNFAGSLWKRMTYGMELTEKQLAAAERNVEIRT